MTTVDIPATEITSAPGNGFGSFSSALTAQDAVGPFPGSTMINLAEWYNTSREFTVIGKYGIGSRKANLALPAGAVVTAIQYVILAYRQGSFANTGDATQVAAASAFGSVPASLPAVFAASASRSETPYFPNLAVTTSWGSAVEVTIDEPNINAVMVDDNPFDKFAGVQSETVGAIIKWDYLALRVTYTPVLGTGGPDTTRRRFW